jgi:hypothetical protein
MCAAVTDYQPAGVRLPAPGRTPACTSPSCLSYCSCGTVPPVCACVERRGAFSPKSISPPDSSRPSAVLSPHRPQALG